jgi:hypothetical protein
VDPHPFFDWATVPFRSTVFWNWTAFDAACDNPQGIIGYSAVFRGTRDGGNPYITGFQYHLCNTPTGDPIYFTTNDPRVVNTPSSGCGFPGLVLDSLDAGFNQIFNVSSRDASGRSDGTPASFRFSCNFPPLISDLTVEDVVGPPKAKRFKWVGVDREDGQTTAAQIVLDGSSQENLAQMLLQEVVIPESVFRQIASENPHRFAVRVRDRAGAFSDTTLSVVFDISNPSP